jgi:hypothetical protein
MNGQSAFGWLKFALALAALVLVGWLALKLREYLPKAGEAIASAARTTAALPYNAASSAVSAATGREETLGGWFAELFDPSTRAANKMLSSVPTVNAVTRGAANVPVRETVKPTMDGTDLFFGAP